MSFKIGNIKIKNNVVLAPMAGVSNPAYIKLCEEMGLGLAYTELISAEAIIRDNKKTFDMLNGIENINIPVGIQIFGSDEKALKDAAKILINKYSAKLIDINMGCPVPKVALRSKAGSALLKDVDKVYSIVKTVVDSVNVPVTVKIRSGWDKNSINAVEIAKACERAGASAITVHPRTRSQGYSGMSDWSIIKQVKDNIGIPVIGNGDIKTSKDAKRMIEKTGCDAIMIGRAALGNPYIIKQTINFLETGKLLPEQSALEKIKLCLKHFDYLLKIEPEKSAVLQMRTLTSYYLKGLPNSIEIKKELYKISKKEEFVAMLNQYMENL